MICQSEKMIFIYIYIYIIIPVESLCVLLVYQLSSVWFRTQKTRYFSIGPRLKAYEIEGPYDKCMDARQLSREMLTCI